MGLLLLFSLLLISCTLLATNGQYYFESMSGEELDQHDFGDDRAAGKAELLGPYSIGERNVREKSPSETTEVVIKERPADESSTVRVFQGPYPVNNENHELDITTAKPFEGRVRANGRDSHGQGRRDAVGAGHGRSSGGTSGNEKDDSALLEDSFFSFSGTTRSIRNGPKYGPTEIVWPLKKWPIGSRIR
ncbi:uncharacterized protein LOC135438108 [Drosophila montana]|uniref:uncharacterized protein LOC135438108 n=1 Tax=Drosophila montana TaxID=40370 RepID=UPI00313AC8F0